VSARVRFLIFYMIGALTAVVFALLANTRCSTALRFSPGFEQEVSARKVTFWNGRHRAAFTRFHYPAAQSILTDCRMSESYSGAISASKFCFLGPIWSGTL
jgi:hypothetical protein